MISYRANRLRSIADAFDGHMGADPETAARWLREEADRIEGHAHDAIARAAWGDPGPWWERALGAEGGYP